MSAQVNYNTEAICENVDTLAQRIFQNVQTRSIMRRRYFPTIRYIRETGDAIVLHVARHTDRMEWQRTGLKSKDK